MVPFLNDLANFQSKLMILVQEPLQLKKKMEELTQAQKP